MRTHTFILLAFVLFLIVFGVTVQRFYTVTVRETNLANVFINDSDIVSVPDDGGEGGTPPPGTPEAEAETQPPDLDPDGNSDDDEDLLVFPDDDDSNSDAIPVVDSVEVIVEDENEENDSTSSDGDSSSDGSAANSSVGSDTETKTILSEDVLTTLVGSQAIITTSSGGNGVSTLRILGNRVRDSFFAQGILRLTIPNGDVLVGGDRGSTVRFTRDDFTLFVSSEILKDDAVGDVTYTNGTLTTSYRVLGRLFGFVPLRYTLHVSVSFSNSTIEKVSVRFPWYKFFLATGVRRTQFEQELRNKAESVLPGDGEFDVATRVFVSISEVLRLRLKV